MSVTSDTFQYTIFAFELLLIFGSGAFGIETTSPFVDRHCEKLSTGQKQRVSIARALIRNPKVLIFDDCLSAVDAQTEQTILQNFKNYIEHKTTIMITHRIFFGFNFDLIIYLEDGKVLGMGTFTDLQRTLPQFEEQVRLGLLTD